MFKNKKIISLLCCLILITVLGIVYSFINNIGIFRVGYNTVDDAITNNELIRNNVIGVLHDNDTSLVMYNDKNTLKKAIVSLEDDGLYYVYLNDNKSIFFSNLNEHYILVNKVNDKYIIEISSSFSVDEVAKISDSVFSEFKFAELEFGNSTVKQWFLVLDEIPEDYTIMIDGKSIAIQE